MQLFQNTFHRLTAEGTVKYIEILTFHEADPKTPANQYIHRIRDTKNTNIVLNQNDRGARTPTRHSEIPFVSRSLLCILISSRQRSGQSLNVNHVQHALSFFRTQISLANIHGYNCKLRINGSDVTSRQLYFGSTRSVKQERISVIETNPYLNRLGAKQEYPTETQCNGHPTSS